MYNILQLNSSLLSRQSNWPSHRLHSDLHSPEPQRNCVSTSQAIVTDTFVHDVITAFNYIYYKKNIYCNVVNSPMENSKVFNVRYSLFRHGSHHNDNVTMTNKNLTNRTNGTPSPQSWDFILPNTLPELFWTSKPSAWRTLVETATFVQGQDTWWWWR